MYKKEKQIPKTKSSIYSYGDFRFGCGSGVCGLEYGKPDRGHSFHMELAKTAVSENQQEEALSYKGKSYIYNEHLSNFLFMGIDTRGRCGKPGCR